MSLRLQLDSSVSGGVITGYFELVKSEKVLEKPSGVPLQDRQELTHTQRDETRHT